MSATRLLSRSSIRMSAGGRRCMGSSRRIYVWRHLSTRYLLHGMYQHWLCSIQHACFCLAQSTVCCGCGEFSWNVSSILCGYNFAPELLCRGSVAKNIRFFPTHVAP